MHADEPLLADAVRFAPAREVMAAGLAARAYPAAVVEVGRRHAPWWREAAGRLTFAKDAPACGVDTVFDLASLTKVLATTSIVMRQVREQRLALDTRVADRLSSWRGGDREPVTIRQLLDHSSGLPAHARLWEHARGRDAFERAIAALPLDRTPGAQSVYSDLGFILLGFLLEDGGGAPLDRQWTDLDPRRATGVRFLPPAAWRERTAPTEIDAWRGRVLQGEVHDENAAALGGVAGHAGLFGTAAGVGAFARLVLETFHAATALGTPEEIVRVTTRSDVPGSSRALGWDTMLPTSSCGTRMSPRAFGHTGFTGASLWIDPEKDVYVVWLTNRVHPTRTNDALVALRPQMHDAIMAVV
ncbi:MAG: serine hydrolase domain-containing protein [Vicinamibacterales bacterium]